MKASSKPGVLPASNAGLGLVGGASRLLGNSRTGQGSTAAGARKDVQDALAGLGSLFLANDRAAIRKTLLRLRYLDKFAEEARARRINLNRSDA